jgi:hypothetical protein
MLTEGLNGSEERSKLVGDEGRAAKTAALVEKVDAGVLQASDHRGSTRGDPAKILRGLGRSGDHRRQGIARRSRIPAVILGLDSSAGRARGGGWKPRRASWRDGEAAASLGWS